MSTATVAAIDCGTNSIRLLVAQQGHDGRLVDLERRMEIVRLGQGVDRTGRLDPAAIARTLAVTRDYADLIRHHGARRVRFTATSATRDATNRDEFVIGIERILGVGPEVITGEVEAALSFRGAVSTLPGPAPAPRLVVDIGGGSTELVSGEVEPVHRISLDMGSVRLAERHLHGDPPRVEEVARARDEVDTMLAGAGASIPFDRTRTLVGVAGTVTTLTALAEGLSEYSPDVTHGVRHRIEDDRALCRRVLAMSTEQLSEYPIIHPGRIDVIGAGALIWERILAAVAAASGIETVRTSEHDILDGLALSML